jgi:hypothetical protein
MGKPVTGVLLALLAGFAMTARAGSWYRQFHVPADYASNMLFRGAEAPDGSLILMYSPVHGAPASRFLPSLTGLSRSRPHIQGTCNYQEELVVLKLDPAGDVKWAYVFFPPTCLEAMSLAATADGGAVIGGGDQSTFEQGVLLRVGPNGELVWSRQYLLSSSPNAGTPMGVARLSGDRYVVTFGKVLAIIDGPGNTLSAEAFETTHEEPDGSTVHDDVYIGPVAAMPDGRYVTFAGGLRVQGENAVITIGGDSLHPLSDGTFIIRSRGDHEIARVRGDGVPVWALMPGQWAQYPSDTDANGDSWSAGTSTDNGQPQLNIVRSDGTPDALRLSLLSNPGLPLRLDGTVVASLNAIWVINPSFDGNFSVVRYARVPNDCILADSVTANASVPFPPFTPIPLALIPISAYATPHAYPMETSCIAVTASPICTLPSARTAMALQSGTCSLTKLDFEFTDDQKVLLHKYRAEGTYPSKYQQRLADDPSAPPADQRIEVDVMVTELNSPVPNKPIYFRVTDPKDTAPYIPNSTANDNRDQTLPLGALVAREPCLAIPPPGIVCALSQQDGFARVVLKTSDHVSGENYRVEASTDASFSCGTGCPRSGTITTWKRVYVEVNRMFRAGTFIAETVQKGADSIAVADAGVFPAPPFLIRLIHGPKAVSNSPDIFYDELLSVLDITFKGKWSFGARPGTLHLGDPNVPKKKAVTTLGYETTEQVRGRERRYHPPVVPITMSITTWRTHSSPTPSWSWLGSSRRHRPTRSIFGPIMPYPTFPVLRTLLSTLLANGSRENGFVRPIVREKTEQPIQIIKSFLSEPLKTIRTST